MWSKLAIFFLFHSNFNKNNELIVVFYTFKCNNMSNIPPSEVAHIIIKIIDAVLKKCGLPHSDSLEEFIYIIAVIVLAWAIGWTVSKIAVLVANKMPWRKRLSEASASQVERVLLKSSRIIPPVVFLSLIPFAFTDESKVVVIVLRIVVIYLVVTVVNTVNNFFDFLWHRYDEVGNVNNHPLQGLPQIAKGVMWIIGVIIIVSVLVNKSPIALLTGLGAFAAVVMLVFKDSLLGLVAGVQLSQNDMLRVGDWIVVPGTPANGIVAEVSLTVVKVRNWDNTMAMLPPYTLVSTSFRNWRAMFESGRRQINRSYNISSDSICEPSEAMLEDLKTIPLFAEFVAVKQRQAKEGVVENTRNSKGLVNGTIETNLGLFRAYITLYLQNHPLVAQDSILLVSELEPTPQGVPIRLYCYTSVTDWVSHESVQSEIFEHVAVMAPRFHLDLFQYPISKDFHESEFCP